MLCAIRAFFASRGVMEVETPLLMPHTVTDPYIDSIAVQYQQQTLYLQTSPEYAMKRLLAAGSGPIYQISKAFRHDEVGRLHNPEFTLLEWYRPGFDHHQLMDEMDQLLSTVAQTNSALRISYQQCFLDHLQIDPFALSLNELQQQVRQHHLFSGDIKALDADTCCQLLLNGLIEPQLGLTAPVFLYDFPPSQAALARIRHDQPPVAERFELYINGIEIANGFHELADATEQHQRFLVNQGQRRLHNKAVPEIDQTLLAALRHGLPQCAGVALGVDRLLMVTNGYRHLADAVAFLTPSKYDVGADEFDNDVCHTDQ